MRIELDGSVGLGGTLSYLILFALPMMFAVIYDEIIFIVTV